MKMDSESEHKMSVNPLPGYQLMICSSCEKLIWQPYTFSSSGHLVCPYCNMHSRKSERVVCEVMLSDSGAKDVPLHDHLSTLQENGQQDYRFQMKLPTQQELEFPFMKKIISRSGEDLSRHVKEQDATNCTSSPRIGLTIIVRQDDGNPECIQELAKPDRVPTKEPAEMTTLWRKILLVLLVILSIHLWYGVCTL